MSGLREQVKDAITDAWDGGYREIPIDEATDAVMRVLAEHGDTQQVREGAVTVLVATELLGEMGDWSHPVRVRVDETPGVSTGYEMTFQTLHGGGAEQVREQIDVRLANLPGTYVDHHGHLRVDHPVERVVDEVMAVVAPIVAARDAAVERADDYRERYEIAHESFMASESERDRIKAELADAVERAEEAEGYRELAANECDKAINDVSVLSADLAAARMQVRVRDAKLDQMRALCSEGPFLIPEEVLAVLDAPARPAGHDETGQ